MSSQESDAHRSRPSRVTAGATYKNLPGPTYPVNSGGPRRTGARDTHSRSAAKAGEGAAHRDGGNRSSGPLTTPNRVSDGCGAVRFPPGSRAVLHKAFHGEFDPGSGRTLAACLTHASRAERPLRGYSSGERVSNTWTTYLSHRNTPGKPGSMPDNVQLRRALYQR